MKVYLDNNATTRTDPEVVEAMLPYFTEKYGNPSSIHSFGQGVRKAIDDAREKVAAILNATPREIYFTSGGTEADNLAIFGTYWAKKDKGNHIITSKIEHHAVLRTCQYLEKQGLATVTYLPVDKQGIVDVDALKDAITDETILITIMHANNEIGTIQPIEEIAEIASEKGIYFHTDAVQTVGKIPIDVQEIPLDMLALSGHKIYGPNGIGAIYIRKGTKLTPLLYGGHHERSMRAGTENIQGIVGLGKAAELAQLSLDEELSKVKTLRDRLHNGIVDTIEKVYLNGHPEKRLPNTVNLAFEYIEGESILMSLNMFDIAASAGSACTSDTLEASHVLQAMGIKSDLISSSVRFSLGKYNTEEEIDFVIEKLPPVVERLRSMSPLTKKS